VEVSKNPDCQHARTKRSVEAVLFDCAICFAVASLMYVAVFGLLAVLCNEPF